MGRLSWECRIGIPTYRDSGDRLGLYKMIQGDGTSEAAALQTSGSDCDWNFKVLQEKPKAVLSSLTDRVKTNLQKEEVTCTVSWNTGR